MTRGKRDEAWVKKEIQKQLNPYRPQLHWDMPPANMYGVAGRHDFLIVQRGLFWTIEAKFGANKPTDNQINYAIKLEEAGSMSVMINEDNIPLAGEIAEYVSETWALPYSLAHDFRQWRKNARKK